MSRDLFNYYSELIPRELEKESGLRIGGENITNLRYADDTVLLAESQEDLQRLLDRLVVAESERKGLSINCKKTESMVTSRKKEAPTCNLKVKDKIIKQVSAFNYMYLGSTMTEDSWGPLHKTLPAKKLWQNLKTLVIMNLPLTLPY